MPRNISLLFSRHFLLHRHRLRHQIIPYLLVLPCIIQDGCYLRLPHTLRKYLRYPLDHTFEIRRTLPHLKDEISDFHQRFHYLFDFL
jgi:hypothetical protein